MQVGESESVCIIDDDGVRIRNVNTVLHDRRREQHIIVVIDETNDDFFQLLRLHLSVSDGNAGIRNIFMDDLSDMVETFDAVADEEHLSVATHLKVDGIGYHLTAERTDFCLYRIAVGRRCADDTHITGTHQREL